MLAAAPAASAATGALTGQGCIADVGDAAGCGTTQQGLDGAGGVAASPDGKSVYVASSADDAIVRFDRNTSTGALTVQGCIADVGDAAGCGTTQQGLNGAQTVAVSADGKSVYVASGFPDHSIVRFDRNTTSGELTPQGCIADVGDGAGCGTTQQGLSAATDVAVSPDGNSVYVASQGDSAIVRFDRDAGTGALTGQGCIADVGDPAGCGTTQQGLGAARSLAVSADDKSVYVGSQDDAIVRFDRNTITGGLTGQGCIADVGDAAGCGTTQQGLNNAERVVVSADGTSVYVAGFVDHAIVRFDRNTTTGALTGQGCIADVGDAAGCGTTQQGLFSPSGLAASSDGKSVYVAGFSDGAIVRFDRNTTSGALSGQGCIQDVGLTDCGTTQQGLSQANGLVVSPDAKSVYVASRGDDAVVNFNREDPPETQIDMGPTGATNDATPTFTFSSDEPGVTFACRVDGASFGACSGSGTHTTDPLPDGGHTFEVRATDSFGTADASPASQNFTVDTQAPSATIDSGPTGATNDATPTFTFSSADGTAAFTCSVDQGTASFGSCSGSGTHTPGSNLPDGSYTFRAKATDAAGNSTTATRGFSIDTAAPDTTIDAGPAEGSTSASNDPSFTFSATPPEGASFQCRRDGQAFAACSSPQGYTDLVDGAHGFEVFACDAVGNCDAIPATRSWTIDTIAPETAIDSGPTGATTDASPSFTFSSNEPGSTFECRLDSGAWSSCTTPMNYAGLSDGSHSFEVKATDSVGNVDPTPAARDFMVQTTPPTGTVPPALPQLVQQAVDPCAALRTKLQNAKSKKKKRKIRKQLRKAGC